MGIKKILTTVLFSFFLITVSAQNENVFNQLKVLEQTMLLPIVEKVTLPSINYNAVTGKSSGFVTTYETPPAEIDPVTKEPIPELPIQKLAKASFEPSKNVEIVFNILSTYNTTITLLGTTYTVSTSRNSTPYKIIIKGKLGNRRINYTIKSGAKTYSDLFDIDQNLENLAGAGVFSIPYLPVGLIYQPPLDSAKMNFASYEKTTGIGATVSFAITNEQSTTKAIVSDLESMKSKINYVSLKLINSVNPNLKAVGTFLKNFHSLLNGLGTYDGTKEEGISTTSTTTFGFQNSQSETIRTIAAEGPGKDDLICYRKNVKFIWFSQGLQLYIIPISDEGKTCLRTKILEEQVAALNGDQKTNLQTILNLNPLRLKNSVLSSPRFTYHDIYTVNGQILNIELSNTNFSSQANAASNYTYKIENYNKGWLSLLGFGISEDKTVKTNITQTSTNSTNSFSTVAASFELYAKPKEIYTVEVYYDNLFKTFVLRRPPENIQLITEGILANAKNEMVTLKINNQTYKTKTGPDGSYKIYGTRAQRGTATLTVKGQSSALQLR